MKNILITEKPSVAMEFSKVLKEINKDQKWINSILNKNNITLENVFYAFYTKEKTFIIKKEDVL